MTTKRTPKKEVIEEETKKSSPDKATAVEQFQRSAAQAIQAYFTKEINDAVYEMTDDVMWTLLHNLEQSEYWIAILRFNNLRLLASQSALNTIDPVVNPSAMSRQQGAMMGVVDLQNAIITVIESEKLAAQEAQAIRDDFSNIT